MTLKNDRRRTPPAPAHDDENTTRLSRLQAGEKAVVVRIATRNPDRLRRLAVLGMMPGARIRLQQRRPAFVVHVGFTEVSVERRVAEDVVVRRRA